MGPQGEAGLQGSKGAKGDAGSQGLKGPKGDIGLQGPMGPQGEPGPQGSQGSRGEAGPTGSRGEVGPMGPEGIPGPQGIPGEYGPRGELGCQGECGCTGPCGPTGACGTGICAALSTSTNVRQQVCANSGISSLYMQPSVEFGGIKFENCGIYLPSKGLYQVTYGVAVEASPDAQGVVRTQFQLNLSSANERTGMVQGSKLSVAIARQLATISLLVTTKTDNSYLQIQNVSLDSSNAPVPVILNANEGVNAFINVVKLQ
jgi:hypothetical protein